MQWEPKLTPAGETLTNRARIAPVRPRPALAPVLAALILAGCSVAETRERVSAKGGDPLVALAEISAENFEAALQAAELADDRAAVRCWSALIPKARELGEYRAAVEQLEAEGGGLPLAYQRTRNLRRFRTGQSEELQLACAAMVDDSVDFVRRLLGRLGL